VFVNASTSSHANPTNPGCLKAMRTKEHAQNVGDGYSSGRRELPAREAGLVCPLESTLPSWGCDRGWRAGAMLRSRSIQEMDGGENKVDEMKVARPPVFVNVHLRKVYEERRRL